MKRALAVAAAAAFAVGAAAMPASANPPHGGVGFHPHHVHTGNGCQDIDAVLFEGGHRGLHRASNESGLEHGPFHGTCATHAH